MVRVFRERWSMKDWGDLDNVTGVYPNAVPNDVSAPGAGDGTKVEAAWVTDHWGFLQAILDYVGEDADDTDEENDDSQLQRALISGLSPVGMVVGWHGAVDPDTLSDHRLLPLEGQTVLIANYQDLSDRCYVGDGNNGTADYYYKSTDAGGSSRSTSGTYITVADCRGAFLRGKDTTATRDPDGATRIFPDEQGWAVKTHGHTIQDQDDNYYANREGIVYTSGGISLNTIEMEAVEDIDALEATNDMTNYLTAAQIDSDETRPINVQTLWCVRY